jgi:hypothetical protein
MRITTGQNVIIAGQALRIDCQWESLPFWQSTA